MMLGLGFGTPFFLVFGGLSDKIGRKWIMLLGMLIAIVSYRPIYSAMYDAATLKNKQEDVSLQKIESTETPNATKAGQNLKTTVTTKVFTDGTKQKETKKETIFTDASKAVPPTEVKTTKSVEVNTHSFWVLVLLVFVQVIFVTMVYGPIAAFLVEMFPVKIRYTSMSLPYHIGNGIFGGLLPAIATFLALRATQANEAAAKAGIILPYDKPFLEGLWYPIIIAAICFVIGALYIHGKGKKEE
jgi:MFS family permease